MVLQQLEKALAAVNQVVLGKDTQVRMALTCLLARGHLLLEDLPGMGKTTLSHALAQVLGLNYQRIQFTADLLPETSWAPRCLSVTAAVLFSIPGQSSLSIAG